jgi:hypothetical protein
MNHFLVRLSPVIVILSGLASMFDNLGPHPMCLGTG